MTDQDERIRQLAADLERDPGLAVEPSTFERLDQAANTIYSLKNRLDDADRYENVLNEAANLLEAHANLGEEESVGLMDVADVLKGLIRERDDYKKMIQGFRERLNLLKMQHIELIEAEKANCQVV